MLLALLGLPVGDVAFEGFIHGHLIGREQERDRTRQLLHDVLSSKILIASFIAHEIYQSLSAAGSEEAKELAKVTKLLQEVIDGVVRDLARQTCNPNQYPLWKRRVLTVF
jgi:hypothetical protein